MINEKFQNFLKDSLRDIDDKNLRRVMKTLYSPQGMKIILDGVEVLNFCSNDYLGLANHVDLKQASQKALDDLGVGAGASRLIVGNMSVNESLEKRMVDFKGVEACRIFSSGYMANIGILSSVFGRGDVIFSDRLNHASLVDGIVLSRAKLKRYKHCDVSDLEKQLKASKNYQRKGIVTDSVFSMDGDVAPLKDIVALAKKYDAIVMVDEAHAFGVMGKQGKGLVEHLECEQDIDIQMGTFSKAAGSYGAYCCGSQDLMDYFLHKARSFVYTTGLPPAVVAASIQSVDVISHDVDRRKKLWDNTFYCHEKIRDLGFDILNTQTPIIPIFVGDTEKTMAFSRALLDEGIFVGAIKPPTVPVGTSRLRLTVTAAHQRDDLNIMLDALKKIGKKLCLI